MKIENIDFITERILLTLLPTDQVLHPLEAGLPPEPEEAEGPVEAASHGDGAEQREHDEGLLER